MHARKLEGIYVCTADQHYWQMSNPVYVVDQTYNTSLHIGRKKDSLEIDNFMIPIESVFEGQVYTFGGYHYSGTIQFKGDSIYFSKTVLLGLGGGNSYIYKGMKTE